MRKYVVMYELCILKHVFNENYLVSELIFWFLKLIITCQIISWLRIGRVD